MIVMEFPKKAGIYKLICKCNNKVYIGKSVNLYNRLTYYEKYSKSALGDNSILKKAILKYGWDQFEVEILEVIENFDKSSDNSDLLIKESYYIEMFDSTNKENGYNICKFSIDRTGIAHSDSTKEKMRNSKLGKTLSEEHKANISNSKLGKKASSETKNKMSNAQMGNKKALGHTMIHSEETKEKISNSHKGKVLSEETKEKLRQINLGRKHSDETKEKIRKSTQAAKAKSIENKAELRSSA